MNPEIETVTSLLDLVEQNKEQLTTRVYVNMCNILMQVYNEKNLKKENETLFPVTTLSFQDIQDQMRLFSETKGYVKRIDKIKVIQTILSKNTKISYFNRDFLKDMEKIVIAKGFVKDHNELLRLYINQRNKRCMNDSEYKTIKQLYADYYGTDTYEGMYDGILVI